MLQGFGETYRVAVIERRIATRRKHAPVAGKVGVSGSRGIVSGHFESDKPSPAAGLSAIGGVDNIKPCGESQPRLGHEIPIAEFPDYAGTSAWL
jgi:hypothetical protein